MSALQTGVSWSVNGPREKRADGIVPAREDNDAEVPPDRHIGQYNRFHGREPAGFVADIPHSDRYRMTMLPGHRPGSDANRVDPGTADRAYWYGGNQAIGKLVKYIF